MSAINEQLLEVLNSRKFSNQVIRYGIDRGLDFHGAMDCLQRVSLKMLETNSYDSTMDPGGYLYVCYRNACSDELRKRKREPAVGEVNLDYDDSGRIVSCLRGVKSREGNPFEDIAKVDFFSKIYKEIGRLSDNERIPLEGYIKGLTYDDISECENTSVGTIKSRINRARKNLVERLEERGIFV